VGRAIPIYTAAASTAPKSGATTNTQSWLSAQPPTKTAGPMLRAGFTEVFVTGMPTQWIRTKTKPMGMPVKPTGASAAVAPSTVSTKNAVRMTSTRNAAVR
jgi:hypothetical protein